MERGAKLWGEEDALSLTSDLKVILQRGKYKIQFENRMERDAKCVIFILLISKKRIHDHAGNTIRLHKLTTSTVGREFYHGKLGQKYSEKKYLNCN